MVRKRGGSKPRTKRPGGRPVSRSMVVWLRMVGADGAVHETNLTAQAAANSKAELALVKAEEAKAELKQERARRDALQWTHDRDERGPGYELAREKGMREAAMKAEGEAKARRNSEIKARKEEEERRMAAESALADALEELKASKSRTAVAERALADEQKARGSLAERCEQRGATVAETAASLKGAQRELGACGARWRRRRSRRSAPWYPSASPC